MRRALAVFAFLVELVFAPFALAAPAVIKLADNLYAYVSDNDHSSNSTFLVGRSSILVVDTGLNEAEGRKLLAEIRKISPLPVRFIVNTHYHPDHQGGNGVVGPDAIVISSPFTRERTQRLISQSEQQAHGAAAENRPVFRAASLTFLQRLTIYVDGDPVEIISPGPAHTMGDVYVYFPNQKTIATGDLFMSNSCPAMDQGSADNWVRALNAMAALPVEHFVPGHFEVATRSGFLRFRDYMADLESEVERLYRSGATVDQVREQINMAKYQGFRQFPQFRATFADNAEAIYRQLRAQQ
jgi:cyclase